MMRPANVASVSISTVVEFLQAFGAAHAAVTSPLPEDTDVAVSGVSIDSRTVQPGDLYIGLPGARSHGAEFAPQAVEAGATVVLTDDAGARRLGECGVPVLVGTSLRSAVGPLSRLIFQSQPAGVQRPKLFGITGTNGKTTSTYLLDSLLRALENDTGLIGTIEILAGEESIPSQLTTPESPQIHGLLALMRERGLSAASMEVSSHAITYRRVDGVKFDVAGFTNLTQDHLDLHGDMEDYYQAKAALFSRERARRAVVAVDDEWGRRLASETMIPVTTLSGSGMSADWTIPEVQPVGTGNRFVLHGPHGVRLQCHIPAPGAFNVMNAALAAVMVHESGVPAGRIQEVLDAADPFSVQVPGRMEVVGSAPAAIVDFAHNSDALERTLQSVRTPQESGRVIVVFGATGERDQGKRTVMGAIAARNADVVIVTDDDPHDEDAASIRAEVFEGADTARRDGGLSCELSNVAPRAAAIEAAVEMATRGDVILVAGRGHEVWQEVNGVNLPLDDRVELRAALQKHGFTPAGAERIES
ncbi:UDP-N-acetylmuramoyl-L-alanyl-D-glutamate--2,6-diaminopimelate ligase [Arthrobacter castelli]|uniref:UDP-N-acetylmuramoyl-L-alanyl-D-glutamate--2, 6-diaminopimelate ligase n=1 Tax=Arthrobacter castelli TaxID=271431 RepID=UPI00047DD908|nr:UDP-N-acetylmuramoyl-L-alanyl-D-glutamate--2,6-diaminopimelate ligase [Arthrobacter castelli]